MSVLSSRPVGLCGTGRAAAVAILATLGVAGWVTPSRAATPAKRNAHAQVRPHAPQHASATRPPLARRSTRQAASKRVAKRPADPSKSIIPEGDGSPVLTYAARYLGRPYRFGADSGAFDCSGFVRAVFADVGIELPRSANEQFARGDRVARDELEPGDLVFFHTYRRYATHVGIYVGDGKFVHATTRGGQVQVDSLNEAYYVRRYLGARRLEI
ncbi:MAG: C40 family peptidase [Candidatus Binatia bacterium]